VGCAVAVECVTTRTVHTRHTRPGPTWPNLGVDDTRPCRLPLYPGVNVHLGLLEGVRPSVLSPLDIASDDIASWREGRQGRYSRYLKYLALDAGPADSPTLFLLIPKPCSPPSFVPAVWQVLACIWTTKTPLPRAARASAQNKWCGAAAQKRGTQTSEFVENYAEE
jgi:hypothetical protein